MMKYVYIYIHSIYIIHIYHDISPAIILLFDIAFGKLAIDMDRFPWK